MYCKFYFIAYFILTVFLLKPCGQVCGGERHAFILRWCRLIKEGVLSLSHVQTKNVNKTGGWKRTYCVLGVTLQKRRAQQKDQSDLKR